MSFDPLSAPVDYVLLSGRRSPGIAEIVGAGSPRKWDKRRGYGQSGSTLVWKGDDLSPFAVQLRLYSSQDWADWHAWKPLVMRAPADESQRHRAEGALHGAENELAVLETIGTPVQVAAAQRRVDAASRRLQRSVFGPRPRALDIWHPILEDLGIGSVVVENVLQPLQTGDGEWTVEVKFIQFRAPRPALARPRGSEARPTPTDPVEIEILRLSNQADALARELAE